MKQERVDEEFIYPTGTCFDDVYGYILSEIKCARNRRQRRDFLQRIRIVHGLWFIGENADELSAHAWVEDQNCVVQAGIFRGDKVYYRITKEEFYAKANIQHMTRYTFREAAAYTENSGPWIPEYLAYTKDGRAK